MRTQLVILLMLLSVTIHAQKKTCNCGDFYTGTFYLEDTEKLGDTCFVYRNASTQREVVGEDIDVTFTVFWLNECTYVIRDKGLRTSKKIHPSDVVAKIVSTTENSYTVKTSMPGQKKVYITLYVYPPRKS